ncbi:protein O-linked-mannose beta-1,2-N-acetylglucosaminyltransferase 1-like [Antedon mediterranea]|uniref:protein O-linked-mannose beta-1,2-N-acetylglucosaminyltransferase 1-like n=1 Tax=Antedon mediterranea TaxID=105859 RepID=UPI003AF5EA16
MISTMKVIRLKNRTQNIILVVIFLCSVYYFYKHIFDESTDNKLSLGELSKNNLPIEEKIEYEDEAKCGNAKPCVKGQYAVSITSGSGKSSASPMCFNGVLASHDISRGMNVLVIDELNGNIISEDVFDLWGQDSNHFIQFLDGLATGQVIVVATVDEASKQLSEHAREILRDGFGSRHIELLNYRGTWAFIGQKNVEHEGYYEKINPRKDKQYWAEPSVIRGCIKLPLSEATELEEQEEGEIIVVKKEPEEEINMCGRLKCGSGTIAVHVRSSYVKGKTKIFPMICVDGQPLIYKDGGTGTAGRGLNVVVFDPKEKKPVKTVYYDTYDSDTDDRIAASLFHSIKKDHFVIVTTHDEVTRKLGFETMGELRNLGSQHINSLGFRSSWAFIGQGKINGNSPYELVGEVDDDGWGTKVEIEECVPKVIKKEASDTNTDTSQTSKKKISFCKKYDSYGEFCNEKLDVPLLPVALDDASLKSNPAYSTPIIIVSGPDLPELQKTMDSVLQIPGLNNKMVVVVVEETFEESTLLVQLYNFRLEHVKTATTFAGMMHKTMRLTMSLNYFKDKNNFIMIEDRINVSPDLLRYYSQTLHLLQEDSSIFTVSAWNEFGISSTSSDPSLLYRTELFIGYVWVLQRSIWDKEIRDKEGPCCNRPTWQGWFLDNLMKGREVVAPDVSRASKRLQDGYYVDKKAIEEYHHDRLESTDCENEPKFALKMVKAAYEDELKDLITMSLPVDEDDLEGCMESGAIILEKDDESKNVYSVFYEYDSKDRTLLQLCKCFNLYVHKGTTVRNIHNGLIRFTMDMDIYFLIGSKTEYYELKPDNVVAVKVRS